MNFRGAPAGAVEVWSARAWNVLNEGRPFTLVATAAALLGLGVLPGPAWLAVAPLAFCFTRYAFPLRLRAALWAGLVAELVLVGIRPPVAALVLTGYALFTVGLWGTLYYHLRTGARWTNAWRFWRLVVENPDPTSGNALEQVPKLLLLVGLADAVARGRASSWAVAGAGVGALAVAGLLHLSERHRVPGWATGRRPTDRRPAPPAPALCGPPAARAVLIVIDGCRADRLASARTPVIDGLGARGMVFDQCLTVYPARTVTCFSSMLTGAPPRVHGMRSNFVPRLGVRCPSIFDSVSEAGLDGRLVGIAHLIDAFGSETVTAVSAVAPNHEIDKRLWERARAVLEADDPELLVLQLLSVDQAGHVRGSYGDEYLERIEATDALIGEILDWLGATGRLEGALVMVTADHGQGRGIGGHGHWTEPERRVPLVLWGEGVPEGVRVDAPVTVMDVATTLAHRLGAEVPARAVGRCLLESLDQSLASPSLARTGRGPGARRAGPVGGTAVFIPARDEEATVGQVVARVAAQAHRLPGPLRVAVVDDGSTDATAAAAAGAGAAIVASGGRGLGSAVRAGLRWGRGSDVVAFLDADGEYQPEDLPVVVAPIVDGGADYVVGCRQPLAPGAMPRHRRAGNALLTTALSLAARRRVRDGQSGMRAFSASAARSAEVIHDYNYAQVLTLDLLAKGFRMAEVPIRYQRARRRSYVRPARYLVRVLPAMARELLTR